MKSSAEKRSEKAKRRYKRKMLCERVRREKLNKLFHSLKIELNLNPTRSQFDVLQESLEFLKQREKIIHDHL